MSELRLGDVIDDFCVKCRRLTNHSIVSIMNSAAAKVRCRTCYSDHDYRNEQAPPSKKELARQKELFNAVLAGAALPPVNAAAASAEADLPSEITLADPPADAVAEPVPSETTLASEPILADTPADGAKRAAAKKTAKTRKK